MVFNPLNVSRYSSLQMHNPRNNLCFYTEHANLFPKPSHPPFFLRFSQKGWGCFNPPAPWLFRLWMPILNVEKTKLCMRVKAKTEKRCSHKHDACYVGLTGLKDERLEYHSLLIMSVLTKTSKESKEISRPGLKLGNTETLGNTRKHLETKIIKTRKHSETLGIARKHSETLGNTNH